MELLFRMCLKLVGADNEEYWQTVKLEGLLHGDISPVNLTIKVVFPLNIMFGMQFI